MEQETVNDAYSVLENHSGKIWLGLAIGTAIGLGIAFSRRKKSRWDVARRATKQLQGRSADIANAAGDLVDRVKNIYAESAQLVEDACDLWSRGRKMVGY